MRSPIRDFLRYRIVGLARPASPGPAGHVRAPCPSFPGHTAQSQAPRPASRGPAGHPRTPRPASPGPAGQWRAPRPASPGTFRSFAGAGGVGPARSAGRDHGSAGRGRREHARGDGDGGGSRGMIPARGDSGGTRGAPDPRAGGDAGSVATGDPGARCRTRRPGGRRSLTRVATPAGRPGRILAEGAAAAVSPGMRPCRGAAPGARRQEQRSARCRQRRGARGRRMRPCRRRRRAGGDTPGERRDRRCRRASR